MREREVVVGGPEGAIVFASVAGDAGGPVEALDVSLRATSLQCTSRVWSGYADGFGALAAFFADMADSWRGWSGVRTWEAVEGELVLTATHDGHVHLHAALAQSSALEGWRVDMPVVVEPGEQLSRVANEIAQLVR